MTDILSAVATAMTSMKTATEIAKLIKNNDINLEKAELNLKIAEIIGSLADARVSLADATDSVREKECEIQKLKELLSFNETLMHYDEAYYSINKEGKPVGHPYCQHCWEAKKSPIHLSVDSRLFATCPSCKHKYRTDRTLILE